MVHGLNPKVLKRIQWKLLMLNIFLPNSRHFTLKPITTGAYLCIHKPGEPLYSNAGIIDLGENTLLVDATGKAF
jgi:hypothetical protein